MHIKYIFYLLLFPASFAVGWGILNQNAYVKQFTFGFCFAAMILISVFQSIRKNNVCVHITFGDIFVLGLLSLYGYFYTGTCNDLDFALPFVYFLFYCFMRIQSTDSSQDALRALSLIIPIVILLHVLICVFQFAGILPSAHKYFSAGSTFGNPDMLGAYLAVLLPFCFICKYKIFGKILSCLTVILLLILQARTAIVAVSITGILYLFLSGKLSKKTFFLWIPLATIAGLVLLIWWHPSSFCGRLFIWFISLKMLVQHPEGWGLYAFEKHYPEFQCNYIATHNVPEIFNPDVVHSSYNEFLNIGVTMGIGGLLLFVALVIHVVAIAYKTRSPLLYPACSFLIVSLSYFPSKIVPLTIVCIAFLSLILQGSRKLFACTCSIRWRLLFFIPLLISVLTITGLSMVRYNKWQMAVKQVKNEDKKEQVSMLFEDNYPAMKGNGRFMITRADFQYRMGDTLASLASMQEASHFFCDVVFLMNIAELYEATGQIQNAKTAYNQAVNISPAQFNAAYQQILFLQRIGEKQAAYDLSIKLFHKPIKSSFYVDPYIIKERLRKIIQSHQQEEIIIDSVNLIKR
ncbi:MAG: hypothetical protein LBD59_12485 [Prevotellaceae bacterium]|jgi:hypothetical protein|nr:hypothetical protein [Prevotellaceae bacterium]